MKTLHPATKLSPNIWDKLFVSIAKFKKILENILCLTSIQVLDQSFNDLYIPIMHAVTVVDPELMTINVIPENS